MNLLSDVSLIHNDYDDDLRCRHTKCPPDHHQPSSWHHRDLCSRNYIRSAQLSHCITNTKYFIIDIHELKQYSVLASHVYSHWLFSSVVIEFSATTVKKEESEIEWIGILNLIINKYQCKIAYIPIPNWILAIAHNLRSNLPVIYTYC